MCVEIQIKGGKRIDGVGDLYDALGRENVVFNKGCEPTGDNECLCHVNIRATARKAGFYYRNGWKSASCDYIFERRAASGKRTP